MLDFLAKKITNYIVKTRIEPKLHKGDDEISKHLKELKELREILIQRDEELRTSKIEWDKTFDAIIDDIVIINCDGVLTKANKSFIYHIESLGGLWKEVIGKNWSDIRIELGIDVNIPCVVDKCINEGTYQEDIISYNNRTFSVVANPVYDNSGNLISIVRVSRDITKLEQQKHKIDRRGRIFEAISKMSRVLVDHEKWDNALSEILKYLGESVGASRAYIFENEIKDNRMCANLIDIWINADDPNCDMAECINYDLIPEWRKGMEVGDTVEGHIKDCTVCPEKEECMRLNDTIVCAVPIFANKQWYGFIGFDYDTKTKAWKEDDEAILRTAADIIGGVIYHRNRYYNCLDKNHD